MKTTELFLKISCHYSAIGRREDSYNKQGLQKNKLSTFLTTRARKKKKEREREEMAQISSAALSTKEVVQYSHAGTRLPRALRSLSCTKAWLRVTTHKNVQKVRRESSVFMCFVCVCARAHVFDGRRKCEKLMYLLVLTTVIIAGAVKNIETSVQRQPLVQNRAIPVILVKAL